MAPPKPFLTAQNDLGPVLRPRLPLETTDQTGQLVGAIQLLMEANAPEHPKVGDNLRMLTGEVDQAAPFPISAAYPIARFRARIMPPSPHVNASNPDGSTANFSPT